MKYIQWVDIFTDEEIDVLRYLTHDPFPDQEKIFNSKGFNYKAKYNVPDQFYFEQVMIWCDENLKSGHTSFRLSWIYFQSVEDHLLFCLTWC